MMKESTISKRKYILAGVVSGLGIALLLAFFDYYNERPFSQLKFIGSFLIIGLINGYVNYRAQKISNKN